jgi:hypothetical protein
LHEVFDFSGYRRNPKHAKNSKGAEPLGHNAYKVPLAKALLRRALENLLRRRRRAYSESGGRNPADPRKGGKMKRIVAFAALSGFCLPVALEVAKMAASGKTPAKMEPAKK